MAAVREGLIGPIDSIATAAAHDRCTYEVIAAIQRLAKHFLAAPPGAAAAPCASVSATGKRMSSEW